MEILDENLSIINSSFNINPHRISVAPMLDITNKYFRYLFRLITKETMLWTEMINENTIINSKKGWEEELSFDSVELPLVCQLGGNDPNLLEKCANYCKEIGYSELNINCGCPSGKVINHNFGVCLMKKPELVADCCKSMSKSGLITSVKCRLGIDVFDKEFLSNFILKISEKSPVKHFIIHSRVALMGVDTVKNRSIPSLMYDKSLELTKQFNDLEFTINGGFTTKEQISSMLNENKVKGVMIGRAAYNNPFLFSDFDSTFYNKKDLGFNREEILYAYSDYCDKHQQKGIFNHILLKPINNLFSGEKYNSEYKQLLSIIDKSTLFSDHIKTVIEEFRKLNKDSLIKTNIK